MNRIKKTALLALILGAIVIGGTLAQYDHDSRAKIPSAVTFHHPVTGAYLNDLDSWIYWFSHRGWVFPTGMVLVYIAGGFLAKRIRGEDEGTFRGETRE